MTSLLIIQQVKSYLQAVRIKRLDRHCDVISLPIQRLDGSFVHTSKPTLPNLQHPAEVIGCISQLLELENTQVAGPLLVQLRNASIGGD